MKLEKICSKCKFLKKVKEFSFYFSKRSNKLVLRECCKICRKNENKKVSELKRKNAKNNITNLLDEIWKPIISYESLYEVSNMGRIKTLEKLCKLKNKEKYLVEKILKLVKNKNGYIRIGLTKNNKQNIISVHRLVAIHFITNPENKPQVNHKKGIKTDNRATELEWATGSENQLHSFAMGLQKPPQGGKGRFGILNGHSKEVIQISLDGFVMGVYGSQMEAARETGVKARYISNVITNRQITAGGYYWK